MLKEKHPWAYTVLASVPINWHASGNEGIVITPAQKFPVLNLNRGPAAEAEDDDALMQVRWNNDDRATLELETGTKYSVREWYAAARIWNSIIRDPVNEYWEQLVPGRVLSIVLFFLFPFAFYVFLQF